MLGAITEKQEAATIKQAFGGLKAHSSSFQQAVEEKQEALVAFLESRKIDSITWHEEVPEVGKFEMAKHYHRRRLLLHIFAQMKFT